MLGIDPTHNRHRHHKERSEDYTCQGPRHTSEKPVWKSYNWTALTPACQQEFRRINLHWHDLRHEYASRLVERGVPLAQVRDLLGHASITTTERYDKENLQAAVLKLDTGKTFDPNTGNDAKDRIDDRDKVSSFFQVQAKVPTIDAENIDPEIEPNSADLNDLGNWLGGRDSNPDNVVQSHVSYR